MPNYQQAPQPAGAADAWAATRGGNDHLVISYLALRVAVGTVGIALPFVLFFGNLLLGGAAILPSMSDYYHTGMRNVFVGSMCVIAVFMLSYHGYERTDDLAGDLAGIFALGIALFPVTPEGRDTDLIGAVHNISAAGFFLTLAYFCLALFRKTDPAARPTRKKLQRNRVYTACGYVILACLALIALFKFVWPGSPLKGISPVFWLEALAVVAFGVSWFTKGEAILKDEVSGAQVKA